MLRTHSNLSANVIGSFSRTETIFLFNCFFFKLQLSLLSHEIYKPINMKTLLLKLWVRKRKLLHFVIRILCSEKNAAILFFSVQKNLLLNRPRLMQVISFIGLKNCSASCKIKHTIFCILRFAYTS